MRPAGLAAAALALAVGVATADPDHRESAVPAGVAAAQAESISYAVRVTDNNQMGITITNYGFIGNNFTSRSPSMEYPLGTGYEHMVRGGLWIGAQDLDDRISVVTGTVDGAAGSTALLATEFTPAGNEIAVRSTLPYSKFYDRAAISEQDFIGLYSDQPAKRAAGTGEDHHPLGLLVRQENFTWSFADFQHTVFFHFVITNTSTPLTNAWVGFYAEMASGFKNGYSTWPPTTAGGGVYGSWFDHKWLEYDASLRLLREHYCYAYPPPGACQPDRVPEWVGIKLLGTGPEPVSTKQLTLAAWHYSPGSSLRDEDTERYAIMSSGTTQDLTVPELQIGYPTGGDPVTLLAAGPFAQIDPGDSITVDFAVVGGDGAIDPAPVRQHALAAQRAFDLDYKVPVPPPSPPLKVVARDRALDLYWNNAPELFADSTSSPPLDFEGYRVYGGEDRTRLLRIGQFDLAAPPHDTTGFNTGFTAVAHDTTIDGQEYQYRYSIEGLRNGFKYFVGVTSYDLGTHEIESLESGIAQNKTLAIPGPAPGEKPAHQVFVFPNPYRVEARWDRGQQVRDHYLWFTNLPERCTVRIYTLSGDLVFETPFSGTSYHADGTRGVFDPRRELDVSPPTLSGSTLAWNLITREGQAAATGLYLYSVEDAANHHTSVGKFLIVKSDREGF